MIKLFSSFVKNLSSFISKFLKWIHSRIILFFYLLYVFVGNPKHAYSIFKKIYIHKLEFLLNRINLNFRIIFKFKYLIFIFRLILYLNALFGAGMIIFYIKILDYYI